MHSRRLIFRHALISLSFALLYLLLNRPEVIFFSRIGFVAWYPAVGLVMALMLGVSPWYAILACFADAFTGRVIYAQPVTSFSNTVGAAGIGICYGAAAYVLRGPAQIDLGLRRRQDVVRYVLASATAAVVATIIGVGCLVTDHSIPWGEYIRMFVIGSRRRPPISTQPENIPLERYLLLVLWPKPVAKCLRY